MSESSVKPHLLWLDLTEAEEAIPLHAAAALLKQQSVCTAILVAPQQLFICFSLG